MRKILFFVLVIACTLPSYTQNRKKVGLVLSGGGAKGVAHIGALKVIEEAGIPIDYIAGTSMGAIVGGLYAIGYTPHQLDSMVKSQNWSFLLSDEPQRATKTFMEKEDDSKYVLTLPFTKTPKEVIPDGIIKGQNLESLFTNLTIGYHDSINFNKLPIPYACVAVDLVEGREIVFHSGKLATVMRASMAIPAAFTPVRLGNMVLVDGGLINNFPVDVALDMGADIIIGVDVQNEPKKDDPVATVTAMIDKMSGMLSKGAFDKNLKNVDLYIKVDVEGYNAASFNTHALDTLNNRGEFAARSKWDGLIQLKKKIGIPDNFFPNQHGPYSPLSDDNPVFIRNIIFPEADKAEIATLMRTCRLKENSELTMATLREAVDELYAMQIYSDISYTLNEVSGGYDLVFSIHDNRVNMFRLGLRFDWEEVASVLLNGTYNFDTHIPTSGTVTGRFGKRSGVRLDYNILPNPLRFFNLSYSYQYNDINLYKGGKREYNTTYHYHLAEVGYTNIFNRDLKLGAGIRYEYFKYRDFLYNHNENPISVEPDGYFSYYASLRYETMDKKVYPTKGTSLQGDVSVYTDNFYQYNGESPFAAISLWWKSVYSLTDRIALVPSVYGRVLLGDDEIPYPFLNAAGGDIPARYVPQQLPFEGITYMEAMDNSLFIASLRLRQRLFRNHYVFLTTNCGVTNNKLKDVFDNRKLIGGSISYGYNSLFGPLEASLNYSNRTRRIGFYLNIGYKF